MQLSLDIGTNMADPFKNPLSPRERQTSSTFAAPTKEQATTGRWMQAGDNYGVGYRTPIGKERASDMSSGPIPQKSKCMNPEDTKFKD
jgi:hypothetical protein